MASIRERCIGLLNKPRSSEASVRVAESEKRNTTLSALMVVLALVVVAAFQAMLTATPAFTAVGVKNTYNACLFTSFMLALVGLVLAISAVNTVHRWGEVQYNLCCIVALLSLLVFGAVFMCATSAAMQMSNIAIVLFAIFGVILMVTVISFLPDLYNALRFVWDAACYVCFG